MNRRRTSAIALTIAGGLVLAGCAGDAEPTSAEEVSAVIALPAEPPGTDPIMTRSVAAWNIYYALYDGLTRIASDGTIEPGLATEWESSADLTTWTFVLRDGVVFHDGTAVTADDIVATYETILASPESTNRAAISMLATVESDDAGRVVFTLNNAYAAWPSMVGTIGIVPAVAYADADGRFAEAPVGTGPYKFVSQSAGVDYVVTRNDDYWGDAPEVADVTFAFVGAEDARVTGVESGTLDIASIPASQVPVVEANPAVEVATAPGNQVAFLGINPAAAPLADVQIREAIALAVDRDELTANLLGGLATPTGQLLAEGVQGNVADYPVPAADLDAAAALVAGSDYDGTPITLQYASSGGMSQAGDVAQAIAGTLTEIGLNIELAGTDQATFSLALADHAVSGLYLNGWAPSVMDGDVVVSQLLAGGPEDYFGTPEMVELYSTQQAAVGEERDDVYRDIWALNDANVQTVPLYANNYTYAIDPSFDWSPAADGIFRVQDIRVAD